VTTALRFHPGELLLALPVRLSAVVLLGVSLVGGIVFEVVFRCRAWRCAAARRPDALAGGYGT
jgi:hypothetical protein